MQSPSVVAGDQAIPGLLMRYLDRQIVEAHVVCTAKPSKQGAAAWDPSGRLLGAPALGLDLVRLARTVHKHRIQIIHTTERPRDAGCAILIGRLTGARTIIHTHLTYEQLRSGTAKRALAQADAIVGVSHFVTESIAQAGFCPERVFTVPHSVDLSDSMWDPAIDGGPLRREFGISDDAPVLGVTSRLFGWEEQHQLLEVIGLVKREFENVRLVIASVEDAEAKSGRGRYRAELEYQARRLGLEANVIFTGWRPDMPRLLAAFDIYVMPSWEEPFSLGLLEAMGMQKPVVAWASGVAPEIVVPDQTGVLVHRGSIAMLAMAIISLLRDPQRRKRLGEAGRRHVQRAFTPEHMSQTMLNVYRAVLENP